PSPPPRRAPARPPPAGSWPPRASCGRGGGAWPCSRPPPAGAAPPERPPRTRSPPPSCRRRSGRRAARGSPPPPLTPPPLPPPPRADRPRASYPPPIIHAADVPSAVFDRIGDVAGWPVVLLGLAALLVGLWKRPLDAAVVFPLGLLVALFLVASRGQVSRDDVGRMLSALCLFAAAGGGALLGGLPTRVRAVALPATVAVCAIA